MKLMIVIPIHFADRRVEHMFSERLLATVAEVLPAGVQVDTVSLPMGATPSIECRSDLAQNAPLVVALAQSIEALGYDGIFVTDMDMCGVEAAREHLSIPIIGGFRSSAHAAMLLADRFSLITILDEVVGMQLDHVRTFGLSERFCSIRVAHCPVSDLLEDPGVTAGKVYAEARRAVTEDGAGALILGCTGFIGVAAHVEAMLRAEGMQVPVLDPNRAAISQLYMLVANGLRQSGQTYRRPRAKSIPSAVTGD